LEVAEQAGDVFDVGIDELHLVLAGGGLAVAEDPEVGADAGVVEHVVRQAHDGLQQIVFQHVAADFAFATARAAGEQRLAIEHDAKAAATVFGWAHLAEQVQQEEHRAV